MLLLGGLGLLLMCVPSAHALFGDLHAMLEANTQSFTRSFHCNKNITTDTTTRIESFIGNCNTARSFFGWGVSRTCMMYRMVVVPGTTVTRRECCDGYTGDMCQFPLVCNWLQITDSGKDDVLFIDVTSSNPTPNPLDFGSFPGVKTKTPVGICYDSKNFLSFFNDISSGYIYMANITAGTVVPFFNLGTMGLVTGLTCEPQSQTIYITDTTNRFIATIPYPDPSAGLTAIINDTNFLNFMKNPKAIEIGVLDPSGQKKIYWTDWGLPAHIGRANLDGSNPEKIIVHNGDSTSMIFPNGITFDKAAQKLYYIDGYLRTVSVANMDGTGNKVIATASVTSLLFDIEFMHDFLYIIDRAHTRLQRVPKAGGAIENFGSPGLQMPNYMSVVCVPDTRPSSFCCCQGKSGQHCNQDCPAGRVWNSCGTQCETTCSTRYPCGGTCGSNSPTCPNTCTAGCVCPPGMVLHGGICQLQNECENSLVSSISGDIEHNLTGGFDCGANNKCATLAAGKYNWINNPHRFVQCFDSKCFQGSCNYPELFIYTQQKCDTITVRDVFSDEL